MDQQSAKKVIDAGFQIIRRDDSPTPRIKIKIAPSYEWRTFEKDFASKAARDRRFKELLNFNYFISDVD